MTNTPNPRAAEYLARGWWRTETFLDDLRRQVNQRPHKTAVVGRRLTESRSDALDFLELSRLTDRFAGALIELGVQRGDVVAVQLPNRWEMAPLMFACMAVGAIICPISPICPEPELRHRLGLTGARVCVTIPEWAGEPLAKIAAELSVELPALRHVLVVGVTDVPGTRNFHEHFLDIAWEKRHSLDGLASTPDDPYVVLFTSGTTGESKGVLHSQNTLYGALQGYVGALGLDENLVAAVSTPLCHYSGFGQGILTGVMVGGTTVFQDANCKVALLGLIERHGATLLYGPPATLAAVHDAQLAQSHDVRSLRQAIIGSALVLPELVQELREVLGARTHSLWGMSEFGPVTITRAADPEHVPGESSGRAINGMEVRIDPAGISGDGAIGRLWVRGAAQSLGYYKREDVFAAAFDEDGWFDTGDLAREDGHGGIRIVCRFRDAIIRDGQIVPVVEVEALLERHPLVAEAALVGLPGGDDVVICAVVAPSGRTEPTLDDLRDFVREVAVDEAMDDRFQLDRVEVVTALPRTLTGKVRKAELRHRYGRR